MKAIEKLENTSINYGEGTGGKSLNSVDYCYSNNNVTGESQINNIKTTKINFGKYEIRIKLSERDEFLGIEEIIIPKTFIQQNIKMIPGTFHDIEKYYKD